MRISLLQFFKTFLIYLGNAFFWPKYFITAIFMMQPNIEKVIVMKYFGPKIYDNFEIVFFGKPDLMTYRVLIESSHNRPWLNFENQQAPYPCMAPMSKEGSILFLPFNQTKIPHVHNALKKHI